MTVILEYLENVEGTLPFPFLGWGLPPLIITNNYGVSYSVSLTNIYTTAREQNTANYDEQNVNEWVSKEKH